MATTSTPNAARWSRKLGDGGWLRYCVPAAYGGVHDDARRPLARADPRDAGPPFSGLADFAFAMQGLGSGTISLFGSEAQKRAYLPAVAAGREDRRLRAHRAELRLRRRRRWRRSAAESGDGYVVDGAKTYISNGGIADFYVLFARTGEAPGAKGISAFIVDRRHRRASTTASASR